MESTHCFGHLENLIGVYCAPSKYTAKPTAVVMITAGMLHHVGPMRMHVQLAKQLSERGVASLRFDLSGIGESLAVASHGTSLERAQREVAEAMNWLQQQFGFEQFVLFGLCSGADDALATAVHDERVVGISVIDGCGYRTRRFYTNLIHRKYWPKLLSPQKWIEKLGTRGTHHSTAQSMPIGVDIREYPAQPIAEQQLNILLKRCVHMQFVYTGGAIDYYSYADQFFEMFPSLPRCEQITVEYLPEADHLLMLQSDRKQLIEKLADWIAQVSGSPAHYSTLSA